MLGSLVLGRRTGEGLGAQWGVRWRLRCREVWGGVGRRGDVSGGVGR